MASKSKKKLDVKNLRHKEKRPNLPPAEMESVMTDDQRLPIQVAYARRNRDLDPQLMWRGKDDQGWHDLVVPASPLYIQEKIQPQVLIDDLRNESAIRKDEDVANGTDLFNDFNGLPNKAASTDFYRHQANWTNRMILGDSLHAMASMAEREGLRGQVQCIYIDPPYGIKFNSNFQWSTTDRRVVDGNIAHITREPEVVKAFRDTWEDGIHSYMTYLRDRFTVARDLLNEGGSLFVQIGDDNVHRVRVLLDEVFGSDNFISQITYRVKSPLSVLHLARTTDFIIWYAKSKTNMKFRNLKIEKDLSRHPEFTFAMSKDGEVFSRKSVQKDMKGIRFFTAQNLASSGYGPTCEYDYEIEGRPPFSIPKGKSWKTNQEGMRRLDRAGRLHPLRTSLRWRYFYDDAPSEVISDIWSDTFSPSDKSYVVETSSTVVQRCMLMTTDPGDLVVDPTCGSGTTAYTAERWGRRWITIDTSRVALALARSRIMGARFPYYVPYDSEDGLRKEMELGGGTPTNEQLERVRRSGHEPDIYQGFVYERVPHVTLKSISTNKKIDIIWSSYQDKLEPLRKKINGALEKSWQEWQVPRLPDKSWPAGARKAHASWWKHKIARQSEIDKAIAANASSAPLYDKPVEDNSIVRVSGPFTVESLSPYRALVDMSDDTTTGISRETVAKHGDVSVTIDFVSMVMENLKISGVQQLDRNDRISFTSLTPWPGRLIAAEGRYQASAEEAERRAAIFVGDEFGTVQRVDLAAAARECAEAGFDVLIACAFSFAPQCTDLESMGSVPILRARMNPDLHMDADLKSTETANLFVVFGEPDIDVLDDGEQIKVRIKGVDVFKPQTGEVESCGPDLIACWFVDTNYNEESFFVRHAYFLGTKDAYKDLKRAMGSAIDTEAWESLRSEVSRPFDRPATKRIAVKVINHLGDEVMKVFEV